MHSPSATTIPRLLAIQAAAHGGRTALAAADGPALSYAELAATIDRLTTALAARGVGRTSRLAVALPNGLDVALGLLAASSAAVSVPLAAQATADEYRLWFETGRVDGLLTAEAAAPAASQVAAELGLPVHLLSDLQFGVSTAAAPGPDDVAVVLMTSGSTGTPKRVPLTHANLLAGATSVAGSLDLGPADRVLVMWEQHHVGGLVDLLLAPLVGGGTAVCAGGFDAARFFALLDRVRPTWFQGVPATLRELLVQARQAGRLPLASPLRFLRSVAAPLPPSLMADLEAAFGVPVIQTFGMTEAAPLITTNRLPPGLRKPGSTGTPSDCEVAVLDTSGEPVPAGATGEVAVRGPNVFAGYEDDPETNARSFRRGWFLTGDVGRFDDDGFLFLTGRVKEMINRGGEKIAPAEVEEAAVRHPAVAQAAAFAIPHPTLGEDVALAVVSAGTAPLDRDEVRRHLAASLSPFKVPAVVLVLAELPRCPIGKLRRRDLTALAVEQTRRDRTVATGGRSAVADDADPLVVALASLWATHLDLPAVDPDADFQLLGGDSLARIRLVLAVESLSGVSLPEAVAASASTVRAMAAAVRDRGGKVPAVAIAADETLADVWADGATAGVADLPAAELSRRLADSRTMLELEATRETLLNVFTLDELAAVAGRPLVHPLTTWAGRLAAATSWTGRATERFRVAATLAAWQRELLALAAAPNRSRWQRHPLAASVIHYRRVDPSPTGRRLVVGFAGNHQRLMLPTHLILDHLPRTDDLLLLSDPDRRHFAAGIRGLAASLPAVCDWLAARQASWEYDALVTFGTSAGGLAAICAALALGGRRAVAVGADAPTAHPALTAMLEESLATTSPGRRPAVVLAFDPANRRDQAGGEALRGIVPGCRTVTLDAGGGHNTLRPALEAGRLTALLQELVGTHQQACAASRTAA